MIRGMTSASAAKAGADLGSSMVVERVLERGVDLRQYKENFLKRRLDIRLKARGISDYSQYALLLDSDPSEFHSLLATFSINVTEFFRDVDFYNAFYSHIIPDMHIAAGGRGEIKVWSAGCASGEEAYALAIMFSEAAESLAGFRGRIIATDFSSKSIEAARLGRYDAARLANVPEDILAKYFTHLPNGKHQVSEKLKNMIDFDIGNLATMNAPQQVDAIFCRNVLMYFDKDMQLKILTKFHKSLIDGGYFILGQSEAVMGESSALFETVMPKERIYRKKRR
ncbi:methylase of chemotaxis methyl-accepting protein [Candidatus Nitrososphaera evergladensis SR1]|uniref:protein-glutamate O-methyltransferase n=2 Tax=Nitrososphaera TaxID=497726 RepID=A0A075MTG7_9ARCH|nr:methylase of chemotaxis methyl-accepting protein [Candidatus Nitrososphaera evergladensis SR1]